MLKKFEKEIDNCHNCPAIMIVEGADERRDGYCPNVSRIVYSVDDMWKEKRKAIPDDCPLETVENIVLRNCPFCGNTVKVKRVESMFNNRQVMYEVSCECEVSPGTAMYKLKKDAIKVWNRKGDKCE